MLVFFVFIFVCSHRNEQIVSMRNGLVCCFLPIYDRKERSEQVIKIAPNICWFRCFAPLVFAVIHLCFFEWKDSTAEFVSSSVEMEFGLRILFQI